MHLQYYTVFEKNLCLKGSAQFKLVLTVTCIFKEEQPALGMQKLPFGPFCANSLLLLQSLPTHHTEETCDG